MTNDKLFIHELFPTATTFLYTLRASFQDERIALVRILWDDRRRGHSVGFALPTGLYAFKCRVILVQEAWCEVDDG